MQGDAELVPALREGKTRSDEVQRLGSDAREARGWVVLSRMGCDAAFTDSPIKTRQLVHDLHTSPARHQVVVAALFEAAKYNLGLRSSAS